MSKKLIEYKLKSGEGSIWVEADSVDNEYERISKGNIIEHSSKKFEDAISEFEPAASSILQLINKLNVTEGEVEMGLKFSAKAGIVLASADSEATLKVILKWKKD